MKKLFLVSSFTPVAHLLPDFIGEDMTNKKISFITTASVVKKTKFYVKWAREKLSSFGLIVEDVELSSMDYATIKKTLETNDYIYVCGGNPFYLLDQLQKTRTQQLIIDQINQGKVYIGESSGAIILGSNIEYSSIFLGPEVVDNPQSFNGLNVINFEVLPHYKLFPYSDKVDALIAKNAHQENLVPITNNQAILVNDNDYEITTVILNQTN